jgi:hypothetical protein
MVLTLMSRFFFDLYYDQYVVLDPGGMLLARRAGAKLAAGEMARHLAMARPELRNGRSWIRVRDSRRNEVHRVTIGLDVQPDVAAGAANVTLIAAE